MTHLSVEIGRWVFSYIEPPNFATIVIGIVNHFQADSTSTRNADVLNAEFGVSTLYEHLTD